MNWKQLMCTERIRTNNRTRMSSDLRTEFEKDYHRIISSASFRRLQDKTQVFPLDKSDFIRTRLTHSLEVSSFAKSLGQNVGNSIIRNGLDKDFTEQTKADICDVLQCAGLIHDIGNPAFGHFGESAIQDWFKENLELLEYDGVKLTDILNEQMKNDFYNFEGNTEALRVVTKLHFLVDEYGMNLTKALLATIIKYPGSSTEINKDKNSPDYDICRKKMGYFYADRDIFYNIQQSCGTNGRRHPLAFLLEAADDIAYNTADIEDAMKKGCISYPILLRELKAYADAMNIMEFIEYNDKNSSERAAKCLLELIERLQKYFNRAVDKGYNDPGLYAVQNWIVAVQGVLLSCATDAFINNYDSIMEGTFRAELLSKSEGAAIIDVLSDVAYRYAFVSKPILKLEVAADNIFDFLLTKFTDAFLYYDTPLWKDNKNAVRDKLTRLMSEDHLRTYKIYSESLSDVDKLYLRLLLVTDYVCGMTDGFAKRLYQELMGINM